MPYLNGFMAFRKILVAKILMTYKFKKEDEAWLFHPSLEPEDIV